MGGLGDKVAELLNELAVHPVGSLEHGVAAGQPFVFTNYIFFMTIALVLTMAFFIAAARSVSLVPSGISNMAEAGVEFVRNLCVDVIGPEGAKFFPFVATVFFFILFNNILGLIPGCKPGTGTIGVTFTLAMFSWIAFVWVGFAKNGFYGYFKSLIPSSIRQMNIVARVALGGYVFFLEFLSTFIVRPVTLSVRLFANMYAGHIILGIFSAFVVLGISGGFGLGLIPAALSGIMLVMLYAFEVFVAFIQAYVFAILTAQYISLSIHTDH